LAIAVLDDHGTNAQRAAGLVCPQADAAVRWDVGRRENADNRVSTNEVPSSALLLLSTQPADLSIQFKDVVADSLDFRH
jgi:hypothetical protein